MKNLVSLYHFAINAEYYLLLGKKKELFIVKKHQFVIHHTNLQLFWSAPSKMNGTSSYLTITMTIKNSRKGSKALEVRDKR